MLRLRVVPLVALALMSLPGCADSTCDDLARMQAERDTARAAYLELARSRTATAQETGRADEELHALERRVYDVEQQCEGR